MVGCDELIVVGYLSESSQMFVYLLVPELYKEEQSGPDVPSVCSSIYTHRNARRDRGEKFAYSHHTLPHLWVALHLIASNSEV